MGGVCMHWWCWWWCWWWWLAWAGGGGERGGGCGCRNTVNKEMLETSPINKAMQCKKRVAYKYYAHTNIQVTEVFFKRMKPSHNLCQIARCDEMLVWPVTCNTALIRFLFPLEKRVKIFTNHFSVHQKPKHVIWLAHHGFSTLSHSLLYVKVFCTFKTHHFSLSLSPSLSDSHTHITKLQDAFNCF